VDVLPTGDGNFNITIWFPQVPNDYYLEDGLLTEVLQLAKEWGSAGACLVIVYFFLKYLKETSISTSMAIANLAEAVNKLSKRIEHCPSRDYKDKE
jgi:hypothetical protein